MYMTFTSSRVYPMNEWCKVYVVEVFLYGLLREDCQEYQAIQDVDVLVERLLSDFQVMTEQDDCDSITFFKEYITNEIDSINAFLKSLNTADEGDGQWTRVLREDQFLKCVHESPAFRTFAANMAKLPGGSAGAAYWLGGEKTLIDSGQTGGGGPHGTR